MRGLRVALIERADFAGETSSHSSKLIHGGLRYLPPGQFRLVYRALRERERLRHLTAPHLMALELGWTREREAAELDALHRRYPIRKPG